MRNASKAPLNHLCDTHDFCDSPWCFCQKVKKQGLKYCNRNKLVLDKETDSKAYLQLNKICHCFSTDEQPQQSMYTGNVQKNECFNNLLS